MKSLKELIEDAQGSRSQNEFALHTGVSSGMIGKIKSGQRKPSKRLLRSIADKAYNGVSYNDLIIASGFLPESSNIDETINQSTLSSQMQEATALLKQIDEKNLATVTGYLQGILEMQEEIKRKNS